MYKRQPDTARAQTPYPSDYAWTHTHTHTHGPVNRQWPLSVSADVAAARLCRGGCCAHAAAPLSRETAGDAARGRRTLRSSDRPRRGVRGAARRSASACALLSHCTVSLVLLAVVMLLMLVHMLLLARRGSATRLETRVGSS